MVILILDWSLERSGYWEESKLMLQGPVKYSTGMFRAGHSTISGTSSYPLSVPSKLYMAV